MKQIEQNKMGIMPMGRLVLTMALPLMLSMLLQAFYNVVDSLFVSKIVSDTVANAGDKAMKALTLAMPVQMLMISVHVGTGIGINAILSRFLGQGDKEKASRAAGNAIFIAACFYLIFALFGIFGTDVFLRSQTEDADVLRYGSQYLKICMIGSIGAAGTLAFEKILQATGKTTLSMLTQMSGALTNIVLDYGLVLGRLGMPALGVSGAAIATIIGQCVSMLVGAVAHYGFNHDVWRSLRYVKPDGAILKEIFQVGLPAIVMQSLSSVMTFGMNLILNILPGDMITPFGVYSKLQSFIFMPCFGLNSALIPIIGFSYGARNKERIRQGLLWGMIDALILMGVGIVIIQCLSAQVVGLFEVSDGVKQTAQTALRIISLGYLFTGANIVLQGFCQALGNGMDSLIVSALRMLIILLPLAWLMARLGNEIGVWLSFPIAEAAALVAAIFMTRRLMKKNDAALEKDA